MIIKKNMWKPAAILLACPSLIIVVSLGVLARHLLGGLPVGLSPDASIAKNVASAADDPPKDSQTEKEIVAPVDVETVRPVDDADDADELKDRADRDALDKLRREKDKLREERNIQSPAAREEIPPDQPPPSTPDEPASMLLQDLPPVAIPDEPRDEFNPKR